jgi:hypothetical protein
MTLRATLRLVLEFVVLMGALLAGARAGGVALGFWGTDSFLPLGDAAIEPPRGRRLRRSLDP